MSRRRASCLIFLNHLCELLDSDITATDLNAIADTCTFGDRITPFSQLSILTFFQGPLFTGKTQHNLDCFTFLDDKCHSIVL